MKAVFADTGYWVAKINPLDQWHERAIAAEYEIGIVRFVTSEQVIVEILNTRLFSINCKTILNNFYAYYGFSVFGCWIKFDFTKCLNHIFS